MRVREIARTRVRDAGLLVELSIVACDAGDYPLLEQAMTTDRLRDGLAGLVRRSVVRYAEPHLGALTFLLWPTAESGPTDGVVHDIVMSVQDMDAASAPRRLPPPSSHRLPLRMLPVAWGGARLRTH